jgi:DNA modification methylase
MSHEATNWAIKQRGLKPTTKIVLWHLCDRFNPDYGCFPSQDRLAHDCEISRSTLNDHLGQLEAVGLLRRVPRLDPVTKRQLPTRYILGFEPGFTPVAVVPRPEIGHGEGDGAEIAEMAEGSPLDAAADALPCPDFGHGNAAEAVSDFPAEPCPENAESRVRNPDTNPVREPLSKPVKEEEGAQAREAISDEVFGDLLAALGLDPAALPGWWQGWPPRLHVQRWRDDLRRSTAADVVRRLLGNVRPLLMVTDPPYGVEYDPSWRNQAGAAKTKRTGKVLNDDRADWREAWGLFPGDVAYVWHGALHAATVADSLTAAGFAIRSQIIWAKDRLVLSRGDYHWQHEPCWYAVRAKGKGHWAGDRKQTTLWQIANRDQDADTVHGTQKPVECMRRPILNNSSPGQAVYEPFMGSGTTLIAAETTGRVCFGVELNPAYVDVAIERWQSFTGQGALLAETDETFNALKAKRFAA